MGFSAAKNPQAKSVSFSGEFLIVRLVDGRSLSVPIKWFPRLQKATPRERRNWRLVGRGIGIHWEELDEDISVRGLLLSGPPRNGGKERRPG